MTLQRVDRLKEPPVIGQQYLVPTVRGKWHGLVRDWPVIGLKHEDAEHFDFPYVHYHLDTRFLHVRAPLLKTAQYHPLTDHFDHKIGKPFLSRRKCRRESNVFAGPASVMERLRSAYVGRQCAHGKRGFVCPHKQFPLGSTPAIDGVITCPLHGLRIDAETGFVLGVST